MHRQQVINVVMRYKQTPLHKFNQNIFIMEQWLINNPDKQEMTSADFQTQIQSTTGVQLANYLGSGSDPNLTLTLSANGPGWNPFSINYQQLGNIPYSNNPSNNWSSWNVTDSEGNYYGAITLSSNGQTASFVNYDGSNTNGFSLSGVSLAYNAGSNAYGLSAQRVICSPFPNAPAATPAVYPGTTTPITLSVKGANIIDSSGNNVLLKGLVRPSLEWNPQGQYLSPADIQNMASWGINVIRIDLNQNYWLNSAPATTMGSYKQIIDAMIYYATQNNMAVILDLHWTQDGCQSPMANSDSLTFWNDVASTYKNFGTVMFELFNEPYGIDQNTWLNGGTYQGNKYVGYQQLYNTVRAAGANNIVICNGLDYGYDLSFVNMGNNPITVNGTNIVYGSHPYDTKGEPGYTGPGGDFNNCYQGVLGNYPLIWTEFGDNQAADYPNGYAAVYQRDLDFAAANNVHYTGFAWFWPAHQNDPAFPVVASDASGTPVNGGVQIYKDIQQNPPTNLFKQQNAFTLPTGYQLVNQSSKYKSQFHTKQMDSTVYQITQKLIHFQDEFQSTRQHTQRKEVVNACLAKALSTANNVELVAFLQQKHEETKASHESQYGFLGSFIGSFWRSRTEVKLAELLNAIDNKAAHRI